MFELEKTSLNEHQSPKFFEHIEQSLSAIKSQIKKTDSEFNADDLSLLLQGFIALKKVSQSVKKFQKKN